jgi:hypothetical protein
MAAHFLKYTPCVSASYLSGDAFGTQKELFSTQAMSAIKRLVFG